MTGQSAAARAAGTRAERRTTRRVRAQVRAITGAVVLGLVVSAAGFATRPAADTETARSRSLDLTRAQTIAAQRAATTRPVEGVLLTHATTQADLMRAAAAAAADHAAKFARRTGVDWDAIARCETDGNWRMRGSSFSGGLGFANSTWSGFGGREFAPNAGMASREEQIVIAERVYAQYGLSGWGCRRYG